MKHWYSVLLSELKRFFNHPGIVIVALLGAFFLVVGIFSILSPQILPLSHSDSSQLFSQSANSQWTTFSSEAEYREYLAQATQGSSTNLNFNRGIINPAIALDSAMPMAVSEGVVNNEVQTQQASRVSETNIQVVGVDEPDIIKTDGQKIYFSGQTFYDTRRVVPLTEPDSLIQTQPVDPLVYQGPQTQIISAYPPADLNELASLDESGELLIWENKLLVLAGDKLTAYDVSNPSTPQELWQYTYQDSYKSSARAIDGELYLVMQKSAFSGSPCPIPLLEGKNNLIVPCTDIYHPQGQYQTDTTYTLVKLSINDGSIIDTLSFVGSTQSSVVYASTENFYITSTRYATEADYIFDFISNHIQDILPDEIIKNIGKVRDLDISSQAKEVEFSVVFGNYLNNLSEDDALKLQTDFQNNLTDYLQARVRDLEQTSIVKIDSDSMRIAAQGSVPGHPLNQFALDEYEGNLRIATTTGGRWNTGTESVNDVYVLNNDMKQVGAATNMV